MNTTLGYFCVDGSFTVTLADHLNERAEKAGSLMGSAWSKDRSSALQELARYITGLELTDPRSFALWNIQSYRDGGATRFVPGDEQSRLITNLAGTMNGTTPSPETTLVELIAAGQLDAFTHRDRERAKWQRQAEAAEARALDLEAQLKSASAEVSDVAAAQQAQAAAEARAVELEEQVAFLRELVNKDDVNTGPPGLSSLPSGPTKRKPTKSTSKEPASA